MRATVEMSDADMGRAWAWGKYDEEGLRFALLMTHHELRDLAVRLAALRRREPTQTARILAQYHQAYRDMSAVLATVRDADLDRRPRGSGPGPGSEASVDGEWPVREVAKHILGAEYGFLAVARCGVTRHREGRTGEPTDAEWEAFREPYVDARAPVLEALATASVVGIRDALATIHVRNLRELADITDGELEVESSFWDGPMPVRFRLHRFEEHLRQHTVQLDKTLVGIDRAPTEAHRLVRNIYNALADVESEQAPGPDLRAAVAKTIEERVATLAS